MKYILIVPDGMADEAIPELANRTPLMVANTPNIDALARSGVIGRVATIPNGMPPGSDVAGLSIMGYDPAKYYTGRAPLEAANQGIDLAERDVAFRCNLITTDGENIVDYSAGEITTEEAAELISLINKHLSSQFIRFYPGISYRHLMVWRNGSVDVGTTPPHNVMGQRLIDHLPQGDNEERLRQMIWDSYEILSQHPINRRRIDKGQNAANMIWLWGQGYPPSLPRFTITHGVNGAVISAVDLLRGIARLAGLKAPAVPGATGRIDTNWLGKAAAATVALENFDFVMVHLEAPDECGHQGDLDGKIRAIELVDKFIVGPLRQAAEYHREARIMLLPDHYTPVALRTHVGNPVPFVLSGTGIKADSADKLTEEIAAESPLFVEEGWKLIRMLFATDN